ncbi:MAG: Hpt domain-containing protein, partial [Bacteroidota bacterium]
MQELVESFIMESRELFDDLDNDLLAFEQNPEDAELINKIFRAVHTIKGTSGFLSLEQLSYLTHHFENVLNLLRQGD